MSAPWSDPDADIEGDLRRAIEAMASEPYRPTALLVSPDLKQYWEDLDAYVRVLHRQLECLPRRAVFARWHRRALLGHWHGTRRRDGLRRRLQALQLWWKMRGEEYQ
jgi:hypothetical protein